jgi:ATP-dependent protease ClpP protease subunit
MAVELLIYEPIGGDFFGEGITGKRIARWLSAQPKGEEIVVRLNSPGGDAFEGMAIYNALHRHEARVVVEIDALAASAASIVAMAGDEIRMSAGSLLMIHEAWGITMGPAEDHEKNAELLRKLNVEMAAVYAARTKQADKKLLDWMAEETWLNGSEALEKGFCDVVHAAKQKPTALPAESKAAASLLGRYKHTPKSLRPEERRPARTRSLDQQQAEEPPRALRRAPTPLGELGRFGAR